MVSAKDLEVVEKITVMGETRFKVRIKGTRIIFDVHANDQQEALERTLKLIKTTGLSDNIISKLRGMGTRP